MNNQEWLTAHDFISEEALDSQIERAAFERRLGTDFKKVFTEDLGIFLPEGYLS